MGSFFFFSQERNGFDKTSSAVTNMSWYLLHSIIFQTTILEYNCRWPIWQFFFHLTVNDTLKQQTTALEGLPVIICLMQTRILWWNGEAVIFYQRNKWLHQNVLCWRKYELIFAPPHPSPYFWSSTAPMVQISFSP